MTDLTRLLEVVQKPLQLPDPPSSNWTMSPRRAHIFRAFSTDIDKLCRYRSMGIPLWTAYFLQDPHNLTRVLSNLYDEDSSSAHNALTS